MGRKKLTTTKSELVQVSITPRDKAAFDAWCTANGTTMSEIVRKEIEPYITKGRKMLESDND